MNIFVVGINHKTAPVALREKLSFGLHEVAAANRLLKEKVQLQEGLILSTCNRVEIYAVANTKSEDYANKIKLFLSRLHNINSLDFENRLYIYKGQETVEHLYKVASGLDSMVIGEVEILGQVKMAYQKARESKTTGKILNKLFQRTFNAAKKVRSETFITRGVVSVSSVAVRLARKILGSLKDKKALIIGTGKIGEQLILYLKENSIETILVANRTFEKAKNLADKFGATAIKFENFKDNSNLIEADIVITSTGAPHCIIHKDDILNLMPKRKQRPLFIIDLAVPRDIETEVNKIDNVYLYDIDDLQKTVDKNIALRQSELDNCQKIIKASSERFIDWLNSEDTRCKINV